MIEFAAWFTSLTLAYLLFLVLGVLICKKDSLLYEYCFRVLVSIDQTVNAVFWGNEDVTISGRAGRRASQGSRFWAVIASGINFVSRDKNHCRDAIEGDERQYYRHYALKIILIYAISGCISVITIASLIRVIFF